MSLTKRQQASLYRHAAKVIERDGWTSGTLHRDPKGIAIFSTSELRGVKETDDDSKVIAALQTCTHCAAGALNLAALEQGVYQEEGDKVSYANLERNLVAELQVLTTIPFVTESKWADSVLEFARQVQNGQAEPADRIITVNDTIIKLAVVDAVGSEWKKEEHKKLGAAYVAKFFRKVARHLEHGGGQ